MVHPLWKGCGPVFNAVVVAGQGMGENNAIIKRRSALSKELFVAAAAAYQALHGRPDGAVPATFQVCLVLAGLVGVERQVTAVILVFSIRHPQIVYLIGWKPHPSQPQPLPRGSAKASLTELGKSSRLA